MSHSKEYPVDPDLLRELIPEYKIRGSVYFTFPQLRRLLEAAEAAGIGGWANFAYSTTGNQDVVQLVLEEGFLKEVEDQLKRLPIRLP